MMNDDVYMQQPPLLPFFLCVSGHGVVTSTDDAGTSNAPAGGAFGHATTRDTTCAHKHSPTRTGFQSFNTVIVVGMDSHDIGRNTDDQNAPGSNLQKLRDELLPAGSNTAGTRSSLIGVVVEMSSQKEEERKTRTLSKEEIMEVNKLKTNPDAIRAITKIQNCYRAKKAQEIAHAIRENKMKTFELEIQKHSPLRQTVFYMLFLFIYSMAVFLRVDGEAMYFSRAVHEHVVEEEFLMSDASVFKNFNDVANEEEFWQYLSGPFAANVSICTLRHRVTKILTKTSPTSTQLPSLCVTPMNLSTTDVPRNQA